MGWWAHSHKWVVNANWIFLGSKLSNLESRKVALSVCSEVIQQWNRQWRAEKIKFVPGKLHLESDLKWGMVSHAYYPNTGKTEQKNLKFKSQPTMQDCLKNQTALTMKQTTKRWPESIKLLITTGHLSVESAGVLTVCKGWWELFYRHSSLSYKED